MIYEEVLNSVIDMAETACGKKIVIGSMPPDDGIAMIGNGYTVDTYLDIGTDERISITVNGKSSNQEQVYEQLEAIHKWLTRRKDFPHGDGWQIYSIQTVGSPRLIGREENSQWLYGSSIAVRINQGGI